MIQKFPFADLRPGRLAELIIWTSVVHSRLATSRFITANSDSPKLSAFISCFNISNPAPQVPLVLLFSRSAAPLGNALLRGSAWLPRGAGRPQNRPSSSRCPGTFLTTRLERTFPLPEHWRSSDCLEQLYTQAKCPSRGPPWPP